MEKKSTQAIIVLHEIYGVNEFIQAICQKFSAKGYDVFCPNLLDGTHFLYEQAEQAYNFFMDQVGFEVHIKIIDLIHELKKSYNKVYLLGFSVGATLAYLCCEDSLCDGIIGCYGSRIRDYTDLAPVCPALLLFAQEASFSVESLIEVLTKKSNITTYKFNAKHGFMDFFSPSYDQVSSAHAARLIDSFLDNLE